LDLERRSSGHASEGQKIIDPQLGDSALFGHGFGRRTKGPAKQVQLVAALCSYHDRNACRQRGLWRLSLPIVFVQTLKLKSSSNFRTTEYSNTYPHIPPRQEKYHTAPVEMI
jgi:hypothetical protein